MAGKKGKGSGKSIPPNDGPSDTRSVQSGSQVGGSQRGSTRQAPQVSGPSTSGGPASQAGSQRSVARQSQAAGPSTPGGPPTQSGAQARSIPSTYPAPLGFDPAREARPQEDMQLNKRIDLPPEAYVKAGVEAPFAKRPGLGSNGRSVNVAINQYRVLKVPSQDVHQYDISLSPEPSKLAFVNAIWRTNVVQTALQQAAQAQNKGQAFRWLFDGRKLAWSRNKLPDMQIKVDMDVERGRTSNPDRPNTFSLLIRRTSVVRLAALKAYLEGTSAWDSSVLEAMSFLDHLIRQGPSEKLLAIKRNFYDTSKPEEGFFLNESRVIAAVKGIYASIRLNSSIKSQGLGLGVNVDVANTVFWRSGNLREQIESYVRTKRDDWGRFRTPLDFADAFKPVEMGNPNAPDQRYYAMSPMFKELRKFHKVKFTVRHRAKTDSTKSYTIKGFVFDDRKYGREGANSRTYSFEATDRNGVARQMTIEEYFRHKYDIVLRHPRWPLVETTRDGVFPLELLTLSPFQQYHFKLDPRETANMIKFAVTRPEERAKHITRNVQALGWNTDPYLQEFGLQMNPSMQVVKARVIPNPVISFGSKGAANRPPGTIDPKVSGRWDLRGQVFATPNRRPLASWCFVVIDRCCDRNTVQRFAEVFQSTFQGHGGVITAKPSFFEAPYNESLGDKLEEIYQKAKGSQEAPDMMFFVLPDKVAYKYDRLKRNMDCRYACLSQMLNKMHVQKAQPQYCSNVAMKVNAKLGGKTSRIAGKSANSAFFTAPTMMIGVDVSHSAPGSVQASMAAMTVSMDKDAAIYAGVCETNGHRVEVIPEHKFTSMLGPIVAQWKTLHGTTPQHVYYFRDGVSEGQFAQVMESEVAGLKRVFTQLKANPPLITVIVATKRHHIRFFPTQGSGDRFNNPLPGTVVETEVTHPFHYDFYLCSHVAIQGTARPVHYHVIFDQIKKSPDQLQQMIYQQCYQYIRSTTPVSLHPAVYYAHLASNRARSHEDVNASARDPHRTAAQMALPLAKFDNLSEVQSEERSRLATLPLLTVGGKAPQTAPERSIRFFNSTMWYI